MAKDPKSDRQPADANVAAIQVSPLAKNDGEGSPPEAAGGDKDGEDSATAQTKAAPSARRTEIDKAAASPRWEG